MNRWWCMDCRAAVELDKHGRCGCCESEAIDSMELNGVITESVAALHPEAPSAPACS